jgi:Ca2+-binding EF-hand superfamily protein
MATNLIEGQEFERLCDTTFDKYDIDKSGAIERKELNNVMRDVCLEIGIPLHNDDHMDELMKDTDLNEDSRITKNEFRELFKMITIMKNQG